MLLKLDRSITTIAPVKLNSNENKPSHGDAVKVYGLGLTNPEDKGSWSDILLGATLYTDSDEDCTNQYGTRYDPDAMVCASAPGRDACQGETKMAPICWLFRNFVIQLSLLFAHCCFVGQNR
jgi:hypothetical protein